MSATPPPTPEASPGVSADSGAPQAALAPAVAPSPEIASPETAPPEAAGPASFEALIALVEEKGEMKLLSDLRSCVQLIDFELGRIEFQPTADAPKELANDLGEKLSAWTGERWIAVVSGEAGAPTLDEQAAAARSQRIAEAEKHPLVAAVLETFSDAEVTDVRDRAAPPDDPPADDPPEGGPIDGDKTP